MIRDLGKWPSDRQRRLEWGSLLYAIVGRSFFWSNEEYMGLAPGEARAGDLICVLLGGQVLYVLRPKGEGFHFIGECYMHGMMSGEAMRPLESKSTKIQRFLIE